MSDPPRLFLPGAIGAGATIELAEHTLRHVQALRLAPGDAVRLFNGDGCEYGAVLTEVTRRGARALVRDRDAVDRESTLPVVLAQGVAAGDRMDLVIQKATELGVRSIQPVITHRSIVRLSAERQARRAEHWQNVAIAACEQSGRNRIPEVHAALAWVDWLARLPEGGARILLAPDAEQSLRSLARPDSVLLLVGPEGGLAPEERRDAARYGFHPVRFGPRVLRTETAPIAALAALAALWGDC